ncbi:C10 family peptidase [Enterobacter kobei]|nr:C10 family peptidase [Enterobacter kobei]
MYETTVVKTVPSLMTTKWSQGYPYTDEGIKEGYIPSKDSLVGCTAIAGAQVLKFHQWPKKTKGVLPGYNLYPEKNIDGFEYQWALMPEQLTTASSEEEITATSTLTLDAGLAAQSAFSSSTAGSLSDMITSFVTNFGYDKNVCTLNVDENSFDMDTAEIESLLRENIDNKMPVLIGIPGHAIVCDGYDESGDFYFNYGWGERISRRYAFDYIQAQNLYFGLRPAVSESLGMEMLSCDFEELAPGEGGNVLFSLTNISNHNYNGNLKVVLVDSTGLTRSVISDELPVSINANDDCDFNVEVSFIEGLKYGDRYLQVVYQAEDGIYRPVRNQIDQIVQHKIKATRSRASGLTLVSDILLPSQVEEGDEFTVEFTLSSEIKGNVKVSVFSVDDHLNVGSELGTREYVVDAGEKFEMQVNCSSNFLLANHRSSVTLMINQSSIDESGYYSVIANDDGAILTSTIFCKNKGVEYGTDVLQMANFDLSKQLFTKEKLHGVLTYSIPSVLGTEPLLFLRVCLTDERDGIIESVDMNVSINGTGEFSENFTLSIPDVKQDAVFNLNAEYMRMSEPDEYYYLTPGLGGVVNPTKVTVYYRNFYDYIFLASDIKANNVALNIGDNFKVFAGMTMTMDSEILSGFLCTLQVIMEDANSHEYIVGDYERAAIARGSVINYEIGCVVPDLPVDNYKLFLRAVDLTTANGKPAYEIKGVNNDILNSVDVTVS